MATLCNLVIGFVISPFLVSNLRSSLSSTDAVVVILIASVFIIASAIFFYHLYTKLNYKTYQTN